MNVLNDRQLECFVAVAEERHFGRAAARLHMTQPPLTRRISRLERDVGVTLFRRTARGVELTGAGVILLERSYHILGIVADAVERTRSAANGLGGRLVVGYTESSVLDIVPSLLAGFTERYPQVELALEEMGKNDQMKAIREERIHIGFGGCYPVEHGISVREVLREPLQVAVPAGHHLAGRPAVEMSELAMERFVLLPALARSSFADELCAMFAAAGVTLHRPKASDKIIDTLLHVAATGVCAAVPRSATNVTMRGVAYVPLSDAPDLPRDCVFASEGTPVLVRELLAHLDDVATPDTPAELDGLDPPDPLDTLGDEVVERIPPWLNIPG